MRNFRELTIWKEGKDIVKSVYKLSQELPKEETYGLKSQIQRAAVSIPSNIAEGCSRSSDKDFKRFLEIAQGSAFELETQIIIIDELSFIPDYDFKEFYAVLNKLQKMINNFIEKLKTFY